MPWPQSTDYNLAIQNPQLCFKDEDLRACTVFSADPVLGLPTPFPGGSADVYRMDHPDGRSWAVKCFTREVKDLQDRYAAISDHLGQSQLPFTVEFHYEPEAILVDGIWYPIVKMRWIEGKNLCEFLAEQAGNPLMLDRLSKHWLRLASDLRAVKIGHGDLQHGNVLLVPNLERKSFQLRLIDYDGMYVPGLADRRSRELGLAEYQHPEREKIKPWNLQIDRFSHLLIYTALRAVRVGGAGLWAGFGSVERLLFKKEDLRNPAESDLVRALFELEDAPLRHLLGYLVLAAVGPLDAVPSLEEIVPGGVVQRLDEAKFETLRQILGPVVGKRRTRVDARTPPPRLDDPPPLPSPLRSTRLDRPPTPPPAPEPSSSGPVPTARRLADTSSLPDWMLPEALPISDTSTEAQYDSDPEVPVLRVPPLRPVPIPPTERPPPAVPQYRPVLLEETAGRSGPQTRQPPLVPLEEILDVVEVLNDAEEVLPEVLPVDEPDSPFDNIADEPPNPGQRRRPWMRWGFAGLALVLLGGTGAALVLMNRNRPPEEMVTEATLRAPSEIVLEGGLEQILRVEVLPGPETERPFEVRLVDMPGQVDITALPTEEPVGDAVPPVAFKLLAPLEVASSSTTARLQLALKNRILQEKTIQVVLRPPAFPQFVVPIPQQRIEVGGRHRLTFAVDHRGRRDRLQIDLLGLPPQITQEVAIYDRQEPTLGINLTIPKDRPLIPLSAQVRLRVVAPSGERIDVHQAPVLLVFTSPRPSLPFLSAPREGVTLSPGGMGTLRITVDRVVCKDRALRLRLDNLPIGVTTEEVDVQAANVAGTFVLKVAPNTPINPVASEVTVVALEGKEEIGRLRTTVQVVPRP